MTERLESQRKIAAEPRAIFELLTDPKGHLAIDSTGMLQAAEGERVKGIGDSFVVHMDGSAFSDREPALYDVTVRIVTFDPDKEIAWTPEARVNVGHVWGYKLEPIEGGTLATAYLDWSQIDDDWKSHFPAVGETALRATLGILDRTVAPGKPRPGAS